MNTSELLTRWSLLSLDEIEAELAAGADEGAADLLFGTGTATEMRSPEPVRGLTGPREPVVLLPGIMGSLLISICGVTTLLWINPVIFLKGQCGYLALNHDGTADADPAIQAVPMAIEKLLYLRIGLALRRETDLYEFPYDWRRPIEQNADLLARAIERWAGGDLDYQFTLVGHSMGGLVIRAYLARHTAAAERRVKRVITHGTPHFGAANAIENMALGNKMMAIAAKLNPANMTSDLLLNMPSLYQLLPAPPDLFPAGWDYPANWDLYDAAAWQKADIRQDYLDAGLQFQRLLADADPQVETYQIAGCNLETTVAVQKHVGPDGRPRFELIRRAEGPDGGDSTVPLWSANLPGASVYYVQAKHRYLPTNKQVIDATLALIHGGVPDLPTEIPPRRAGWLGRDVLPVAVDLDAEAEALRERLEGGTATEADLAALYFAM